MAVGHLFNGEEENWRRRQHQPQHAGKEDTQKGMQTTRKVGKQTTDPIPQDSGNH